jgi:hypothetical protein
MSRTPHPRWTDPLAPRVVSTPSTYDYKAAGAVRRAGLYAADGTLLGHVWTDDRQAAGFLPAEQAGPAGVRAGGAVWAILRDAHRAGLPASDVLDSALYADEGFELRV